MKESLSALHLTYLFSTPNEQMAFSVFNVGVGNDTYGLSRSETGYLSDAIQFWNRRRCGGGREFKLCPNPDIKGMRQPYIVDPKRDLPTHISYRYALPDNPDDKSST